MKNKFFGVALLALTLCGTGALAYAQGPEGFGPHDGFREMATLLNLTSAQKQEIKALEQAQRSANAPLHQQLEQIRLSMLNATAGGAFNQATITQLATQQAQIMAQLEVQHAQLKSQIYNQVLTSQQKATVDQMHQNEISQINERLQNSSTAAPAQ